MISPTKIPLNEVYKVFESILEVRGFVAVPAGKVTKISQKREGAKRNIKTQVGGDLAQIVPEDTIITQLIPLEYAEVEKIRNALGQLFSKDASVIPYPTTNTLIVTDVSSNIHRLLRIIKELDIPGYETKITVVPLRYAAAENLASELSQVIEEAGKVPGGPPTPRRRRQDQIESTEKLVKIIPDNRTNSLIVLANEDDTKRVEDLIKRLDVETERTNIHVYFLRNTNSEYMAKVLNNIVSKRKPEGGEIPILISEEAGTNSLIIDATQEDYASLVKIIEKLDIVRDQVLVEVLIAEVSYEDTFELGVEWIGLDNDGKGFPDIKTMGTGRNNAEGFGEMQFGDGGLSSYASSGEGIASSGLKGASIGFVQKMAGSGTSLPDFAVMLHALQTNADVNILATPQILTMDNEEASIKVVRNIPYLSKIEIGTDNNQDYQDVEYKDVGIELTITPHISKEQMVRLEIEQKISSLVSEQTSGIRLTPETFDRETKTAVIVKDNHTIVIGGLVRDDQEDNVSKVPILGDIPLLGLLFRKSSTRKLKNNLLVFITPRVVRTTQQIADLTDLKRRQAPQIDRRITKNEEEMALREASLREEQKARNRDLKARYAALGAFSSGEDEGEGEVTGVSGAQSPMEPAPPRSPVPSAPPLPRGEEPVEPEQTELKKEETSPASSFLDALPRVSFGRREESKEDKRGTGRYH